MKLATFSAAARAQRSVSKYGGSNTWKDGGYLGQCVSLINQYCRRVFGFQPGAWGHAVAWGYTTNVNVRKYFNHVTGSPKAGDILVYGATIGNPYGHIEIYLGAGLSLEQNRGYDFKVHVRPRLGGYYRILRRKTSTAKPAPKPAVKRYVIVAKGWGLSDVAKKAGYKDYYKSARWSAIAKLNGSSNWGTYNAKLKPGQKVRVK